MTLREGHKVSTPWGVLRPAPDVDDSTPFVFPPRSKTSCLLAESRLLPVKFDRGAQPQSEFDPAEANLGEAYTLFPLACALSSEDPASPAVPLINWHTMLLPFQSGLGYNTSVPPRFPKPPVDITDQIEDLEEWSRLVQSSHPPSVDLAARRPIPPDGADCRPNQFTLICGSLW